MLRTCQAVKGSVGLQAHAADSGIEFFEPARRSHEGAAGTEARDKMGDATGGLLPDFVGRSAIVGLPVCGIAVLVGVEIFFRISRDDFVHLANRAVGAFIAWSDHEFGAQRCEDALALVRSAVRQTKLHGKLQRGAAHRTANTRVPAACVRYVLPGPLIT